MDQVSQLMEEGVREGVFPGAVLLAAQGPDIIFHQAFGTTNQEGRIPVTTHTVYDLASLTKPLATASCMMVLIQEGRLCLSDTIGRLHPGFSSPDKRNLSLEQILSHTAGFPAYRPYYEELSLLKPESRKGRLVELLNSEPLAYAPGQGCQYSDLGYMALGLILEEVSGLPLDALTSRLVFDPLGINDLFFMPFGLNARNSSPVIPKSRIAPTESCPWRKTVLHGQVHDDNAWVLGGVAGHAGLFGTALGIWRLLDAVRRVFLGEAVDSPFSHSAAKIFLGKRRIPGTYVLGYDTPTPPESSSGAAFSPRTVGHLGFTGASFWLDLEKQALVILLTNRVHPTRNNGKIRIFRPKIHNAAMSAMGFSPLDNLFL
ncbi:MAG: beta-lactamase family protein [Desulfatibacillum sp.]|nr:beta-lactamase family protein [Desulfatibacillum sp.]